MTEPDPSQQPEALPPVSCSACGGDPFALEAAKAAVSTLVRDNERLRDKEAKARNEATFSGIALSLARQDLLEIREIITKGGSAADILKFLDTPET